jgi:uncharacterized membrane protein (DUF485 family)
MENDDVWIKGPARSAFAMPCERGAGGMEVSGRPLRPLRLRALASLDVGPSLGGLAKCRSWLVVPLFGLSFGLFLSTLLVLSYCPAIVSLPVVGSVNVAYLLALLQFLATFWIAIVYAWIAKRLIDPLAVKTLTEIHQRAGQ